MSTPSNAAYRPVHRADDGEHVGYLLVDACEPPCVIPCDLLGLPLAAASSPELAQALLERDGLAAVDGQFEALLPPVLTPGVDPGRAETDWVWRRVVVVEVSPSRAVLRPASPLPAERGIGVEVPIPADDLLHRARD